MAEQHTYPVNVNSVVPNENNYLVFGAGTWSGSSGDMVQDVQAVDSNYASGETAGNLMKIRAHYNTLLLSEAEHTVGSTNGEYKLTVTTTNLTQALNMWINVHGEFGSYPQGAPQGFSFENPDEILGSITKVVFTVTARRDGGVLKVDDILKEIFSVE